jgi:solute:Na+ symporter, SSS family
MHKHFGIIDWAVLALYFLGTMSIGFYFYRRSRSTEGFTAAGRSLPGWACGLSIFATYLSSISFLALPGKAFASNWNPFVFSLSLPIATWFAVKYFMPYYRKSNEVSAYVHLERRFGTWARIYTSIFYLLTQLARMGAVMYLMALPLSVLIGWDIKVIILFTSLSVIVYSLVGGIVAVIWADAMQAIVLMVGALICTVVLMIGIPGGVGTFTKIAMENNKFSLGSFAPTLTQSTFWVVLIYGVVMNLQNFGVDQSFVQRYIASSSDKEARKSVWLGGLLYVPVSLMFFFIGTQLYVYYQTHPYELNEVKTTVAIQHLKNNGITSEASDYNQQIDSAFQRLTDSDIGDKVFPHFIGAKLPKGITGLLIAAIFAAAMSTVSTSLNSSATLLLTDYYQRYFRKNASERESMLFLYFATVVWGLIGTGVAFLLIHVTSALDAWWILAGIFGGGMLGLFLLGMISRKTNNTIAIAAVILGILLIAIMSLSSKLIFYLDKMNAPVNLINFTQKISEVHLFLTPVFGTMTILFGGIILSSIFRRKKIYEI